MESVRGDILTTWVITNGVKFMLPSRQHLWAWPQTLHCTLLTSKAKFLKYEERERSKNEYFGFTYAWLSSRQLEEGVTHDPWGRQKRWFLFWAAPSCWKWNSFLLSYITVNLRGKRKGARVTHREWTWWLVFLKINNELNNSHFLLTCARNKDTLRHFPSRSFPFQKRFFSFFFRRDPFSLQWHSMSPSNSES